MIVLDASVLIAFLNVDDRFHRRATDLLVASAGPLRASAVTLGEVLVGPTRTGTVPVAQRSLGALEIGVVPVGASSVERLAALRVGTGHKLPDCCVLLAAEEVQAGAVLTFDERLSRSAREAGYATAPGP